MTTPSRYDAVKLGKEGTRIKRNATIAVLLIVLLAGVWGLYTVAQPTGLPAPSSVLAAAAEGLDSYTFDLVLREEQNQLAVTMSARFRNQWDQTLPDIVLRTYAGAYATPETSPAATDELIDRCYPNGFSVGGFILHDVRVDGLAVTPIFDDAARTVLRLPVADYAPGDWCNVELRMVLTLPDCLHRFGRSDSVWLLGNCLPILSVVENGAWRTDPYVSIGDPFLSSVANYNVSVTVPEGMAVLAGVPLQADNQGKRTGTGLALRELALVVYRHAAIETIREGDTLLVSAAPAKAMAQKPLQIAKEALKHYNQTYGTYPYQHLVVAAVPFAFAGMEYPGLVWVADRLYGEGLDETLELTIAHELAHQWFYAMVGSDQFREPWQDEALSEHAMLSYIRAKYGAGSYDTLARMMIDAPMQENIREGITPGSPLDAFHDLDEYASVVYGRGAGMLQALDQHSRGRMDEALRQYVATNRFGLATRQDFEDALTQTFKEDVHELVIDYLDTSM